MFIRFKTLLMGLLVAGSAWVGWHAYHYFLNNSAPTIVLKGIDEGGSYAGNIPCVLSGSDTYRVADISVWLDNSPLITKFRIGKKEFDHAFPINSQALSNGKHTIRVEAVSGTYRRNRATLERNFFVDNVPLQTAFTRPDFLKVFQGRTLHVQFQANKEIKQATIRALSRTFDAVQESKGSSIYEAFIPIACDEVPNEYLLGVDVTDKVGNTQTLESKFQIVQYPFKHQTLTIDPHVISKEKQRETKTYEDFNKELAMAMAASPKEKLWRGAFCVPLNMTAITCDFGTVRTTNERGRYSHNAVDLGARAKSVVWAAQDGTVVMKDRFAETGNTVAIDHGCGICTLYFHLDSFADITVGKRIAKGNPLGVMGKTGYATGDHLHWEMRINDVAVDPMQWTKQTF